MPKREGSKGQPHRERRDGDAQRRLALILSLSLIFMVVEAAGGVLSGSLALLADAGHMLSDSAAMLFSLLAMILARRETTGRRTYGFRRAELLAAFVNSLMLVGLAVWIVTEAVERIGSPQPVLSGMMLAVALAGLAVNLLAMRLLHRHAASNLNLRSALWHITGDLLGSLGAVAAAVIIGFTGWTLVDPILSIAIAVLIGAAGARILYDSANLLLDRAPKEVDTAKVRDYLAQRPGVLQICDLHIWGISSQETMLTAHLVVEARADRDGMLGELLGELKSRFGLAHLTVQLEGEPHATCPREW